jgi:hypothetical protein
MKKRKRKMMITVAIAIAAISTSAVVSATPMPATAPEADTPTATVMHNLREIERNVAAIAEHAAKLEQMNDMPNTYTRSAHEFEWNMIDQRFDEAGKLIPSLQEAKNLDMWEKETIDDMTALMQAMGAQIESATKILTNTPAVEALHAKHLYPVRVQSVLRYTQMIDDHIEAIQRAHQIAS